MPLLTAIKFEISFSILGAHWEICFIPVVPFNWFYVIIYSKLVFRNEQEIHEQTITSKCVSPQAHEIVTIKGQGAHAPLQQQNQLYQDIAQFRNEILFIIHNFSLAK